MGTLKQTKKRFTSAINAAKISVLAMEADRILVDLNGDKMADAALIDTTGNGAPDLLALDLTGDGKFNLFLDDTNDNNFPDTAYIDQNGDGNIKLLSMGETIKNKSQLKLVKIYATLVSDEATEEETYDALRALAKVVKELQKRMKK
ncbi:MAG: hypothetical protein IJ198_02520 [Lachnospiraceae bacterium]|nr:hypothetical protein [Lachnospiraceae bacterium]